jgi:transketolase
MNEVSGVYQYALNHDGPSCIILTRQSVINIPYSVQNVQHGGYIIYEEDNAELIIISTGSEVSLSIEVAKKLGNTRVVSMVSCELFDMQPNEYKNAILSQNIKKISIEAGSTLGWYKYADYTYGINEFGKSGNMNDLKEYFGFTVEHIINFIKEI